MLSPEFQFRDESDGTVMEKAKLRDLFFNPGFFDGNAINVDYILGGQMRQKCQQIDHLIIDEVRDFLFQDGCLDLASLNIQRGRDHGLMTYNDLREMAGLPRAADFSGITSHPPLQRQLAEVYSTVDEVDAWIGGLCEDHAAGNVGELFQYIIADSFCC